MYTPTLHEVETANLSSTLEQTLDYIATVEIEIRNDKTITLTVNGDRFNLRGARKIILREARL